MRRVPNTEDNLWAGAYIPDQPNACWPWQGCTIYGYGLISYQSRNFRAHRLAYQFAYGEIPDDMWVLHACANKPCINPAHLYIGTPKDNSRDRVLDGNSGRGEECVYAKLKNDEVIEIRCRIALGENLTRLSEIFGVSASTISHIKLGKTWKNLLPTSALRRAWEERHDKD